MSSFIVNNETINRILEGLRYHDPRWIQHRIKEEYQLDIAVEADRELLGQLMHKLNVEAVNQRYKEQSDGDGFSFQLHHFLNDGQLLKSLQCFLYQCSEGNVSESPLYQIMRDFEHLLMQKIVDRMPAYANAQWA